tara:strand:- start:693 stop:1820 length:1128 start_codon:yes stop_codon:yes gene_type:complete
MVKIYPKCLNKKELAYTATGYLMPCCWLDVPTGWSEPQIKRLMQKHLKLENNDQVDDIINSKEWKEFFKELKTNPSYTCQKFCSVPLNQAINKAREKYDKLTVVNTGTNVITRGYYEHQDYKSKVSEQKIKICTLYFEGKYTPDYVEKLYNSLKRNCTLPFEFICYSDNPNVKADVVIPLIKHSGIKKHWYKLTYFNSLFANQKPGDEVIIMDIDQVIVNNIDDMIGYPVADNELVSYNKWWGGKPKLNGGFLKFKSGSRCQIIWDTFIRAPEDWQLHYYKKGTVHYKYYGEQNYINAICDEHKINLTLMPPEWVCKLTNNKEEDNWNNLEYMRKFNKDYMILDKPHEDIKIVHFANPNANIHTSKYEWIKDYWK